MTLTVRSVEAYSVLLPLKEVYRMSTGHVEAARTLVVKVHTSEGIVGIGDARSGGAYFTHETLDTMKTMVDNHFGPAMVGEDILNIQLLGEKIDAVRMYHQFTKSALDIALYDALAQWHQVPLAVLLGGIRRDRIELIGGLSVDEPEAMAERAMKLVARGHRTLKAKIGSGDVAVNVERIRRVREAVGPDVAIRVDLNNALRFHEALRLIKQIEQFDPVVVEDPLEEWDLAGMAKLSQMVGVPLCADTIIRTPSDAFRVLSAQAASMIKIKLTRVGGFRNAMKIIDIAESAGVGVILGHGACTSIEATAELHLAAARRVELAGEMIGPLRLRDDIVTTPMTVENGSALLPVSTGLGVTLNEQHLSRFKFGQEPLTVAAATAG